MVKLIKLKYCFAREKKIVFAQQKHSVPLNINDLSKDYLPVFNKLIWLSISAKIQGFCNKCVFAVYAEIQDGHQKWRAYFWEQLPYDSAVIFGIKNLVKITLFRTVYEINALLHFTQKFKMASKNVGKIIFG